jgi:hypothetical protein
MTDDISHSWEIEVKVITKSKIKEYKGGKLFKVDLEDALYKEEAISNGKAYQIEATCFKETLDKFFPIF